MYGTARRFQNDWVHEWIWATPTNWKRQIRVAQNQQRPISTQTRVNAKYDDNSKIVKGQKATKPAQTCQTNFHVVPHTHTHTRTHT